MEGDLSRLNDLLRQLRMENPALADDLEREYEVLADRRSFGLNFERHIPEVVELPAARYARATRSECSHLEVSLQLLRTNRLWRVTAIASRCALRGGCP